MTVVRETQVSYEVFVLQRPMWMLFDPLTKKVLRVRHFPAGSVFRAANPKSARGHFRIDSIAVNSPVYEFPDTVASVSQSIVTIHDPTALSRETRSRVS